MTVGKRFAASSDAAGALRLARKTAVAGGLAAALLLGGCADLMGTGTDVTVSDPLRITRSGFLTDYNRLTTSPGGDGALCWRNP
jgi:hypothetical protein